MRAVVNGKLYDTENSTRTMAIFIPMGDSHTKTLYVYWTKKGNMFAVSRDENIFLSAAQIRELLNGRPDLIEAYMNLFGMPEEA